MLYFAKTTRHKYIDNIVKFIADVVLRPKITENEIMEAVISIIFDNHLLLLRLLQEESLDNLVHMAAYQQNTLGLSNFCPTENVPEIDRCISIVVNFY